MTGEEFKRSIDPSRFEPPLKLFVNEWLDGKHPARVYFYGRVRGGEEVMFEGETFEEVLDKIPEWAKRGVA